MPDCGDLTLWDVFVRNARLRGGRTAVVCGGASWSFRDLAERAERLAAALHGAGVARGDRLAVLAHNCHRFLEVLGAAARLGAVLVPLNHRLNAAELAYILRDSEPTVLFFDDGFRDTAVALARDGGVGTLVALGGEVAEAVAYESWLAGATAAAPAEAASADDVLALVYTAAVDGRPRGAMLTHRNFVAQNVQTAQPLELGEDDVYLNLLPLFHVTDLNMACAVLHAGGTNVMTPRFDPAEAWRLVAETRTTLLATFPPMPARLLEALDAGVGDVSSLRRVLGVLEHPDVIGRFRERLGVRWFAGYGQTETAGLVTLALPEDLERKPGTAGRPLALCRVEVVDEAGGILPAGSVGEIVVRGPVAV
ncbi:MAG: AMP-binding protein, partial [Clostridia bacterium]|nr:AMP-binding protein [Clostridia bacterium]